MAHYDIGDALSRIEQIILASMGRNLNRHLHEEADEGFQWSMWQAEQLTALGQWSAQNLKTHAKDFTRINNAAMQLLQNSGRQAELDEERKILQSGAQHAQEFFDVPDDKMQSLLTSVRQDLSRAEHSILRQADDMYRKAIFDAHIYLQSGSGTLKDAIGMAVQDMHTRGIQAVMYRNGRRVPASVYARMALRTANVRANLVGEGKARDKSGVHTVIVPPSGLACEKCAKWLCKIMVDDVYCSGTAAEAKELGVPLLSEAIRQGFLHPQCNCSPQTYCEGDLMPEFTEADRENAVRNYKLTQQQRYNERQIRKYKAAGKNAPNDTERNAAKAKVTAWQKRNNELCKQHPDILRRDYEREKLYDFTGQKPIVPDVIEKPVEPAPVEMPSVPEVSENPQQSGKVLDNSAESGIIESKDIHAIGDDTGKPYKPDLSYDSRVTNEVREAFDEEFRLAVEKFGEIDTVAGVGVLNDKSTDEGAYNDNSRWISLRHADKKNALKLMQAVAGEKKGKGMWSTGHPRHAIRHEIGHAIQLHHFLNDKSWADKQSRIMEIFRLATLEEDGYTLPSKYAGKKIEEFISECIAASFSNKASKTVREVIQIILEE